MRSLTQKHNIFFHLKWIETIIGLVWVISPLETASDVKKHSTKEDNRQDGSRVWK